MYLIIRNHFIKSFDKSFLQSKMGFAGYPNETINKLGKLSDWHGWDYFGWAKDEFPNLNISESWKIINIEWFLRTCF